MAVGVLVQVVDWAESYGAGRASGVIVSSEGRDGMQGWSIFANAWCLTGLCWLDVDEDPDA